MATRHGKTHKRFYGHGRDLKADRRMSRTAGLPPGTLVHIGEQRAQTVQIRLMSYNEQEFHEKQIDDPSLLAGEQATDQIHWIDIDALHDVGVVTAIGERFGIHPLVLEDVLNTNQRPKLEDYGDYLYIVFKMLYLNGHAAEGGPGEAKDNEKGNGNGNGNEVVCEQVSLILGRNYVISFQERPGDVFDLIRDRIRHGKGRLRKLGADALAYSLMDAVVDNYFVILERIGETIDAQEEELVACPTMAVLEQIHCMRGEMLGLRRAIWPLREVIGGLERGEHALIREETIPYLRDLYDHAIQIIDTIENYRDILAGMMDIYLSSASNRMNEIMKVLTMFSTIFIPLTFLVGIYGMNFEYMPELHQHWAYPALWAVMITVTGLMLWLFKRKRWF
jgi:magnesium transporter